MFNVVLCIQNVVICMWPRCCPLHWSFLECLSTFLQFLWDDCFYSVKLVYITYELLWTSFKAKESTADAVCVSFTLQCRHVDTVESLISIHFSVQATISWFLEWFSKVFVWYMYFMWTVYTSVLCAEGSHLHNCTRIYSTRKPIRLMRRTDQSWHGGKWRSGQSTS